MNAGSDAKYLKDFRVQLGKAPKPGELRFKAQMSLWKNTTYRFSMCNSEESKGKLILSLKDDANKTVLSSFDPKTGKIYPFVNFTCNKSGIYQLNYDFTAGFRCRSGLYDKMTFSEDIKYLDQNNKQNEARKKNLG
jgi:hypothetical protein